MEMDCDNGSRLSDGGRELLNVCQIFPRFLILLSLKDDIIIDSTRVAGDGYASGNFTHEHDTERTMRSLLQVCIFLLLCPLAYGQSYNMTIHLKSGQTVVVPIDSVRRMAFLQTTAVSDPAGSTAVPAAFRVMQNYPNPFNPSTTIAYEIPGTALVRVRIFDTRGALIRDLVHESQAAGLHQVVWDGTDNARMLAASGVYISVTQCDGQMLSRKMILVK